MESNAIKKSSRPAMGLLTSIIICILVLLVGVAGMVMLIRLKKPPAEAANGERSLRVEAIQIKKENIQVFINCYGEVKALTVVPIAPEVSGRIVDIHPRLKIGEIIPKGEVLFKIDPKDYLTILKTNRKRLKILKRSHELAKKEYQRFLVLFKKNNVATLSGLEAAEKKMLAAVNGGAIITSTLTGVDTSFTRCFAVSTASEQVLNIFQLPAISGLRLSIHLSPFWLHPIHFQSKTSNLQLCRNHRRQIDHPV